MEDNEKSSSTNVNKVIENTLDTSKKEDGEYGNVCNSIINCDERGKHICQSTYKRACTKLHHKLNTVQEKLNECTNKMELVDVM